MNEPIFTHPNVDYAKLAAMVRDQLDDELRAKCRLGNIEMPGFIVLFWNNSQPGVTYASNRSPEEWEVALRRVVEHRGGVVLDLRRVK